MTKKKKAFDFVLCYAFILGLMISAGLEGNPEHVSVCLTLYSLCLAYNFNLTPLIKTIQWRFSIQTGTTKL